MGVSRRGLRTRNVPSPVVVVAVVSVAIGCGSDPPVASADAAGTGGSSGASADDGSSSDGIDQEPVVEFFASGFRLRAVTHEVDGLVVFSHWHDLELGVDCTMRPTGEGLRCLPIPVTTLAWGGAACDIPFADVRCVPAGGFVSTPTGGCSDAETYAGWRIGEEYSSSEADVCTQASGYELLDADFVQGSVMVESFGDVDREVLLGADGSWSWGRLLNPESDVPCVAVELDGTVACRPAKVAEVGALFADRECQQPPVIRSVANAECPGPNHGVTPDGSRVYVVGEEVPQDEVFRVDANGGCQPVTSSLASRYFVANEVAPDEFPAVGLAADSGDRLQRRVVESPGGTNLAVHHEAWFDQDLDMPCTVQPTVAGGNACAPPLWIEPALYADDDCRTPLDYRDESLGVVEGTWVSLLRRECDQGEVDAAGRRGGPYEGPVYSIEAGQCTLAPITAGMFELDPIVQYRDLAAVAVRVD